MADLTGDNEDSYWTDVADYTEEDIRAAEVLNGLNAENRELQAPNPASQNTTAVPSINATQFIEAFWQDRQNESPKRKLNASEPRAELPQPTPSTHPSFVSLGPQLPSSVPAPASQSRRKHQQPVHSSGAELLVGRRRTINSLTAHTLVYNERIPPPNSVLRIPDPKPKKKAALHRMPKYHESSSESELTEESDEKENADDNIEITLDDENKMGQQGGPFIKSIFVPDALDLPHRYLGGLGVVARHVATLPEVPQASLQDKWTDLTERVSPVVNLEEEHAANLPTSKKRKSRGKAKKPVDMTKEDEDELQDNEVKECSDADEDEIPKSGGGRLPLTKAKAARKASKVVPAKGQRRTESMKLKDAKGLEVWLWRYMLQRRFLRRQDLQDVRGPMEDEIPAVDTLFSTIERCQDMNIQYLGVSKIGRVMRLISQLEPQKILRDDKFKFRDRARALVDRWDQILHSNTALEGDESYATIQEEDVLLQSNNNLGHFVDSLDDEDEDYTDEDVNAIDRWDGPESWFEPGETTFTVDRTYVFCPAAHRKKLLRMFIRHFCEHPLLPDRSGTTRTGAQIWYDTVYKYCEQRGLREMWGYMWTAWYCPAKYKLWARS
ncbi:hypothetical protein B0H13DRAFT_2301273 [Mycena leptocephala]|nr:hypothetical protein B0H13DRAFT_2301273 [Mycena leptocephala]